MKTFLLSAAFGLLTLTNAKASNLEKLSSAPAASVSAEWQSLKAQHAELTKKVERLADYQEELQSLVSYQNLMHLTNSNLQALQAEQKQDELAARISYTQLMTSVLVKLSKAE